MDIEKALKIGIIFLLGFLTANIMGFVFVYGLENPLSMNFGLTGLSSNEAPFDYIQEDQIEIHPDKVIIHIPDTSLSRYAPTGSMKPLLDQGANGLRVVPKSEEDIHIGDIITFENKYGLIVHRVIDKGTDDEGTYFITKGDNTNLMDGKIRFSDIRYKTIAIIW
jgi:hypothetical protein